MIDGYLRDPLRRPQLCICIKQVSDRQCEDVKLTKGRCACVDAVFDELFHRSLQVYDNWPDVIRWMGVPSMALNLEILLDLGVIGSVF